MLSSITPLIEWITTHPHWAGALVFLISLSESLFVVGLFIPGVAMMTGIGALVGSGVLSLIPTLAYAILGAIAGDGISYWLGKKYRLEIKQWRIIQRYPLLIEKGEVFFRQHGGKSIILGRFIGPIRPIIPAVAGMMNMSPAHFLFFNILSAVAWAPIYTLPGALFGSSFSHISLRATVHLVLLLLFSIIALNVCYRLLRYCLMGIHIPLERQLKRVWSQILNNPQLKPLEALISNAYFPQSHRPLALSLIVFLLSGLMLYLVFSALHNPFYWTVINETTRHFVQGVQPPLANMFSITGSALASNLVIFPFYFTIIGYAYYKKDVWTFKHGVIFLAGLLGTLLLLKYGIHSPRPSLVSSGSPYDSFPSGHTTRVYMALGFWALVHTRPFHANFLSKVLWGICIATTIWVGYSRIYLNSHWLTDIVAAVVLTTIGLLITEISYHRRKNTQPFSILGVILPWIVALPFACFQIYHQAQEDLSNLQAQSAPTVISITAQDWWAGTKPRIPITRKALLGNNVPTFNIQSALDLSTLTQVLKTKGWVEAPPLTVPNMLNWLDLRAPLSELPLFPQFHNNRPPELTVTKTTPDPDRLLVLRLWRSRFQLTPNTPLWLGTVHFQFRRHFGLFSLPYPEKNPEFNLNHAGTQLQNDLLSTENPLIIKPISTPYQPIEIWLMRSKDTPI